MLSNGSDRNTLYPKENVFGETLQNCFFVVCCCGFEVWLFLLLWFVGGGFCKVEWGRERCVFVFFVSRGLLVHYFIFLPIE